MRITLAGYNLDADSLELVHQLVYEHRRGGDASRITELLDKLAEEPLTPETVSAAYARISRSDKSVRELRRDARASVSRARQSNERIVFGLGHASVAEHSAFNIDVTEASRLALEELESHRLASYTEASQRYISMSGDFVVPEEFVQIGFSDRFQATCSHLFEGYRLISEKLVAFHHELPEKERLGRAREDARYLLPLACRGQVGMTVNARNAEWIIQQASHSQLAEVRSMGRQLHSVLRSLVPSLIKYTDPNPLWAVSESAMVEMIGTVETDEQSEEPEVALLRHPEDKELMVIAGLLVRNSQKGTKASVAAARRMTNTERMNLLKTAHSYLHEHSSVRRELELASFIFGVTLSASAFAQLKRHRMATLIPARYDPSLGVTIPPAVTGAGLEPEFRSYLAEANSLYSDLLAGLPVEQKSAAQYVLTNSHRRRVLFQASARELTHFSRLREDQHAQWDIRRLATIMVEQARQACPALMMFAAGKDQFDRVMQGITESKNEMPNA